MGTPTPTLVQLTGTTYGTSGSWDKVGANTIAAATDGNLNTFFDSPTPGGNVGINLGSPKAVAAIKFAPRAGYASRMVGGMFQYSTSLTFASDVTTVYTVTAAPAQGVLTTVTLPTPITAQYWRYLGPANGYGNIAEFQLFGVAPAVAAPAAQVAPPPVAVPVVPPVAPPAVTPTPAPTATSPGIVTSSTTVTVGMPVWLNVTAATDVRKQRRAWNTGIGELPIPNPKFLADPVKYAAAPTINPDTARVGTVVVLVPDAVGTYHPTCTVTTPGSSAPPTVLTTTINVVADNRTEYFVDPVAGSDANAGTAAAPWQTYSKLMSVAAHGNCRIGIVASGPLHATSNVGVPNVGSNTSIFAVPTASTAQATILTGAFTAFSTWTNADSVLFRGLGFTSIGVPSTTNPKLSIAPCVGTNRAMPIQSRGTNIVLLDCNFGTLTQGPLAFSGSMAILRCTQGPASAMSGQVVLADGGPCVLVVFGCNLKGAYGQANCRMDSGGGGYTGTIECNYLEQDPSVGDDALVDLRCADGFVVANNGFMNGQFSASSSIGNAVSITRNILLYSNVYRANAKVLFTGWCQFKPRLAGITMALEDYGPGHNPYDNTGAADVVTMAA